ncbi:hypothetical protein DFJ73DRAFT_926517 [Zopfochytrium polystomum]|nr:hypothetical protein DFJ73DRAFT_926517 [Zopfochytrium polystomum]
MSAAAKHRVTFTASNVSDSLNTASWSLQCKKVVSTLQTHGDGSGGGGAGRFDADTPRITAAVGTRRVRTARPLRCKIAFNWKASDWWENGKRVERLRGSVALCASTERKEEKGREGWSTEERKKNEAGRNWPVAQARRFWERTLFFRRIGPEISVSSSGICGDRSAAVQMTVITKTKVFSQEAAIIRTATFAGVGRVRASELGSSKVRIWGFESFCS